MFNRSFFNGDSLLFKYSWRKWSRNNKINELFEVFGSEAVNFSILGVCVCVCEHNKFIKLFLSILIIFKKKICLSSLQIHTIGLWNYFQCWFENSMDHNENAKITTNHSFQGLTIVSSLLKPRVAYTFRTKKKTFTSLFEN